MAKLLAVKNTKAKQWVEGRKNLLQHIENELANNNSPIVWIHCASLGEFEQGRPIIEAINQQYPSYKIVLTFFSPSGYEIQKNYATANWIFYLPMDSPHNAKAFIQILRPCLCIFVKYDYWYYYLAQLKQQNIPLLLVSGIFRNEQIFFKWYGSLYRQMLQCFYHLFVQTEKSKQLAQTVLDASKITISGDTRFDRVLTIAKNFTRLPEIECFINEKKVLVVGSSWQEDDEVVARFINKEQHIKSIIAPHHVDEESIVGCLKIYANSITYSSFIQLSPTEQQQYNVLIIDNIGLLSRLYNYATIAYVGGAFGSDGVHNVLEAAVYGKPVVFGPEFSKYQEAADLIAAGGGFSINDTISLKDCVYELLNSDTRYKETCEKAAQFVQSNAGATQKIMDYIYEKRLLTN